MKTTIRLAVGISILFAVLALAALAVAPTLASGGQVAYLSNCGGQWDVFLSDVAHRASVNLTRSPVQENAFIWSPDGRQLGILYYTAALGNIISLDLPGGTLSPAALDHDRWLRGLLEPSPVRGDWSNDHQRRVYEMADELYIMDRGIAHRLTTNRFTDVSPSWSPDERQIAFASSRDGSLEIYLMDSDGTNVRRLTHNDARSVSPSWAPDGGEIVYTAQQSGSAELYRMAANGQNSQRLTVNDCWDDRAQWRPGG